MVTAITLLLIMGNYANVPARGQDNSHYFPETGYRIGGKFLTYWNAHGGLIQFGYPVSDEFAGLSDANEQLYTMQYFERAAFELHPENQPPYDVLLTSLGSLRLKAKYPAGNPTAEVSPSPGYFLQTKHKITGKSLAYWQQQGGLMRFGYPLTEQFSEVSDLNGKPYTVQYFERAVFELHPENYPPYDVLLTQVGRIYYAKKYKVTLELTPYTPVSTLTATPTATPDIKAPYLITRTSSVSELIAADHYLFWERGGTGLVEEDLSTRTESNVGSPVTTDQITTNGKIVVWTGRIFGQQAFTNAMAAIAGFDIATQQPFVITQSVSSDFANPIFSDNILYYQVSSNSIYSFNPTTNLEQPIVVSQNHIRGFTVKEGELLWSEQRGDGLTSAPDFTLHLLRVGADSRDKIIARTQGQDFTHYRIDGENILWSVNDNPNWQPAKQPTATPTIGTNNQQPSTYSLHLLQLSSSGNDRVVASSFGMDFVDYASNGDNVFWIISTNSSLSYDTGLHRYQVSNDRAIHIDNSNDYELLNYGNTVFWTTADAVDCTTELFEETYCHFSSIHSYDTSSGQSAVVVKSHAGTVGYKVMLDGAGIMAYAEGHMYGTSGFDAQIYVVRLQ